jgi:hypothetical protein
MAELGRARSACEKLVEAYDKASGDGGSVDWSNVDEAYRLALKALGREHKGE